MTAESISNSEESFNFKDNLGISKEFLNSTFPFYFVLDEYLTIIDFGDLAKKAIEDLELNQGFDNFFEWIEETDGSMELSFKSLIDLHGKSTEISGKMTPLQLWGQSIVSDSGKYILLLLTPKITKLNQVTRYKISEDDFPKWDSTLFYVEHISSGEGGGAGSKSKYAKEDEKKEKGFVVPGLDGSDIELPKDYDELASSYKKMAYEFGKVARASTELQDIIRDKTQELDMQVVMTQEALKKAEHARSVAESAKKETELALERAEKEKLKAEIAKEDADSERLKAETQKKMAEQAKEEAEAAKEEAEAAKEEAEAAKEVAETQRQNALKSKEEAEAAKEVAEVQRHNAELSREEAHAAKLEVEKASEELQVAYKNVDKARAEARAEADEAIKDIILMKNNIEEDARQLMEKVRKILEVVKVASTGDLRIKIPVSGKDAIGQVGDGLNEFFSSLKLSIKEIESCGHALDDASIKLRDNNKVMKQNSDDTTKQTLMAGMASKKVTDGMNEVSNSMKIMVGGIKDITQITTEASKLSNDTSVLAEDTNEIISELDRSSSRIGKVIKLIEAIAHQTNLLSLNAQIEAMWAGEAGKGFRVVANEVKELSKQTAEATQEVEKMVMNIQSDSKKAISAVSQISDAIMTMNSYTVRISEQMVQQSSQSGVVTDVVYNAASSISEINEAIELVKSSAVTTDEAIVHSQASAEDLGEWANNLNVLVNRWKV